MADERHLRAGQEDPITVRIGLIGAGRMGEVFARVIGSEVAGSFLVAVADRDPKKAGRLAAAYGAQAHFDDHRRLLERRDVEAVIVATPTNTHAAIVELAAQTGKHILCEKPLALTLESCDRAIRAVESAGVKLQLGFMRRFDRAYQAAKSKIEEGRIGRPVMFKASGRDRDRTSLAFARRENSGGLIADMAVHDFDLARWLMGAEVVRVHSEGGCLVYPELRSVGDIDNAVVNLRFENAAIGNVDVSRNAVYGYDIRTEVLGSEGRVQIGPSQQGPMQLLTREPVLDDAPPDFLRRFSAAFENELIDFVTCIKRDRPPAVTAADGRAATAISVAAALSLDEERPVLLSELG